LPGLLLSLLLSIKGKQKYQRWLTWNILLAGRSFKLV